MSVSLCELCGLCVSRVGKALQSSALHLICGHLRHLRIDLVLVQVSVLDLVWIRPLPKPHPPSPKPAAIGRTLCGEIGGLDSHPRRHRLERRSRVRATGKGRHGVLPLQFRKAHTSVSLQVVSVVERYKKRRETLFPTAAGREWERGKVGTLESGKGTE